MAANGRSNIHDDAYQTDTYTGPGPLGRNMQRASTFQGVGVRVGHVRPGGADRGGLRGRRAPAPGAARPAHARPAGDVRPAAADTEHGRGHAVHRLLGRRLFLSGQCRPRGGLDQHEAHLGDRPDERTARPGVRGRARLRPHRGRAARRLDHLRAARLVGPDLVRVRRGRGGDGRSGKRRREVPGAGREDRQLVRGRRDRGRVHRLGRRHVSLRRDRRGRPRRDLAGALREHRVSRSRGRPRPARARRPR